MNTLRREFLTKHRYKILTAFISVFCLTCLSLCAEEMSIEKAKSYRANIITEAKKYIGCPYVYGASGPDSFDCSGLIFYVAREANGTQLPRTAKALYSKSHIVKDNEKEPGDLLFFTTTSSGTVSHVGIYIGNNQFISALSDGPNTGVILSSLNEAYWKPRYLAAGRIYRSVKFPDTLSDENETKSAVASANVNDDEVISETPAVQDSYFAWDEIKVDAALLGDWAIMNRESFIPSFRGIDFQANARVSSMKLQPGLGIGFRWNYWINLIQIPITFSMTLNDYLKVYMGPIFSFGNGIVNDSKQEVVASIFPGTIGVSFSTPSLTKGDVKIQLVQDMAYSVFNNTDNSALHIYDSLTSGLVLYSGVKITLPVSLFTNRS